MTDLDLIGDPSLHLPADWDDWLRTADEVAEILRSDAVERDAANDFPSREIELLRSRGLLGVALPAAAGGAGLPFALAAQVTRRIARVDSGIAHILGYHYGWTRILAHYDSATTRRLLASTAEQNWLWASPGSPRVGGAIQLRRDGSNLILNGTVGFATGSPVAQRLFTQVIETSTGRLNVVAVDPHAPGLTIGSEWDMLGQRLSASPTLSFVDVTVPETDLIAELGPVTELQEPFASVGVLNFQFLFGVIHLGITEGALIEARDFTRERSVPWSHSTVSEIGEEPFILNGYGEYVAAAQSVSALVERSEQRLQWLHDRGTSVTADERAQVAETIASAKIIATKTALTVTTGIYDLTGARSAASKYGLDRFWRNARTLSLHDPIAYKLNEVGRYYLNGENPRPSNYR
ncbi:acyl-CoA dehydrogenase family protein [Gryllotalpicola reticulitermitis]|uniref:Acyl-CoA dehydrogenase family protein n=1 Tax=Gryllotalpicola reticulitermitis TaxID=1184153 RepID=A0ABV8Q426_9MICO